MTPSLWGNWSVFNLVRRRDPCGTTGPCFIRKQLRCSQGSFCRIFAKLLVEEGIVESSARSIGRTTAVVDCLDPRPMRGRKAHWAGFATCIKITAVQRERAQSLAGRANGAHLPVRSRVIRGGHHICPFRHHPAVAHNERCKGATFPRNNVFRGQCDRAPQKLRIWLTRHLSLPSSSL